MSEDDREMDGDPIASPSDIPLVDNEGLLVFTPNDLAELNGSLALKIEEDEVGAILMTFVDLRANRKSCPGGDIPVHAEVAADMGYMHSGMYDLHAPLLGIHKPQPAVPTAFEENL